MGKKILFKITTRSRPERFFESLMSIIDNLANKKDYFILVSADIEDVKMFNPKVRDILDGIDNLKIYYGVSYSKINAINRDMPLAPDFDILVNVSDDQKFLIFGFDDFIRSDMPDDLDWFLHYPDSHAGDRLPTMSIMGVNYYKRTSSIYHPDFKNVYCDNFAMDEAKYLGRHLFINKIIYDHYHPAWGTASLDEQYIKNENPDNYQMDRETYFRLKRKFCY